MVSVLCAPGQLPQQQRWGLAQNHLGSDLRLSPVHSESKPAPTNTPFQLFKVIRLPLRVRRISLSQRVLLVSCLSQGDGQ